MISVKEAKQIIQSVNTINAPQLLSLQKVSGLVLAQNIMSVQDIPASSQSSVDGYAFQYTADLTGMEIVATIAAGDPADYSLPAGKAARIFTGAFLPAGADTVVMQENVHVENNILTIEDPMLKSGSNVRPRGSEILNRELALEEGAILHPAAIGFLAGIGVSEVMAFPAPRIKIIVTGNELQQPGQALVSGKVYESNSVTLVAALEELHVKEISVFFVNDHMQDLVKAISESVSDCDMLILSGGVSVGDYDYVEEALKLCGAEQHFHKIKQKPGKPILFASFKDTLVFGLPGNPSSVLTCFYEYLLPAVEQKMGYRISSIQTLRLPLDADYNKKKGLTHFIKGIASETSVTPLTGQESYKMRSFSLANCIICLEEEKDIFLKGEIVEVHLLPYRHIL